MAEKCKAQACMVSDSRKVVISIDNENYEANDLMESIEAGEQTLLEFQAGLSGGIYSLKDSDYREVTLVVKKGTCLEQRLRELNDGDCHSVAIMDFNKGTSEILSCDSARLMKIGSRKIASTEPTTFTLHGKWENI